MADEKYLNIPVQLLEGFLVDKQVVLNNICDYAIYAHSLKLEDGTEEECFASAADFYKITYQKVIIKKRFKNAKELYDYLPENSPKVGLNLSRFWDYYKNHKKEFEIACLLAYLAIKSILGKKSYCKMDNKFLLARMDGKTHSCAFDELSDEVFKYANEYQTKKIKNALSDTWGLVTYSYHTRGFWVSFKLSLDDLVFEAEKRREAVKEKQRKEEIKSARDKALERLNKSRP
ncbi:hypothetical protein [Flavobacterium rhizosphaerae]|uniref:Uncharacterized protein n=1 Tax=Flavobacterium rhizosphaerae TaxID=3163298 RepID=A0ABW8YXY9_9FLAO